MKQIILHDKTHQPPFVLPDVRGTVDHVGDVFKVRLPTFHNDLQSEFILHSEPDATLRINQWIERMNKDLGYTIQAVKDIT